MAELDILRLLNHSISHPILDGLMLLLSLSCLWLILGTALALFEAGQTDPKQWRLGMAVLLALGSGFLAAVVFQFLGQRPRPSPELVRVVLHQPGVPSFPSGHSTMAFAVAMVAGMHLRQARWWVISLGLAGLIGLSRVYLGYHYPSDVLGGVFLGVGLGLASYGLCLRKEVGVTRWRWLLWPQVGVVLLITQMAYLSFLPFNLLSWPGADKVLHFILFGGVAFWLNLWLKGRRVQVLRFSLPLAILIPFSLALVEEGLQAFSPHRTADWTDLLSDLAGMLLLWWLSEQLLPQNVKPSKNIGLRG